MNRSRVTGDLASHGNIFVDIANDRVGIGSTIPGQKLSLPDDAKIALGNGADLSIYHNSGINYIDASAGHFALRGTGNDNILYYTSSGDVEIYHDGAKKFETTAYGIDVTGTTGTDGLSVSGVATATTFSGSGASLTNLNGSNIASGTVPVARIGTGTKNTTTFYRGDGTFQVVSTDLVGDTSPQLGGNLDVQNREITTTTSNANIKINPNGTGAVEIRGDGSSTDGTLQLNCSQNSHGIKLKSPPHSAGASYTLTFPNTDGNANQLLKSDGSGNLDWVSIANANVDASAAIAVSKLATFVNTNADNRVITGSGTVNTLNGEANFTFDGTIATIQNSGAVSLNIGSTNAGGATITLDGDSNGDFVGNDYSTIRHSTDGHLILHTKNPAGASNVFIQMGTSGHYGAMFKEGAESLLRYNNSTKIETTNTGVTVTGTVTATAFAGDGSNLTGITQTTINSNTNNYLITGTGTANTLQGEANLQFDGATLKVGNTESPSNYNSAADNIMIGNHSGSHGMTILSATNSGGYIMFSDNNGGSANAYRGQIEYQHGGSDPDHMRFITDSTEHLRIRSKGALMISGTDTSGSTDMKHGSESGGGDSNSIYIPRANSTFDWKGGMVMRGVGGTWGLRISAQGAMSTNSDTTGEIFGVHPVEPTNPTHAQSTVADAVTDAYFRVMGNAKIFATVPTYQSGAKPFYYNATSITSNETITTSYNAMCVGNMTINSGVTVTVNSGARWVIV